jgi:hypothetical protein
MMYHSIFLYLAELISDMIPRQTHEMKYMHKNKHSGACHSKNTVAGHGVFAMTPPRTRLAKASLLLV